GRSIPLSFVKYRARVPSVRPPGFAANSRIIASIRGIELRTGAQAMSHTYQELLAKAREHVPEIEVDELSRRLEVDEAPLLVDVREQSEWDEGHIPGAVHVPRGFLESRIGGVAAQDREIVISCQAGARSLLAARTLQEMGYANVRSL